MSKRRFVQAVVIRRLPALTDLEACIDYAESVWARLSQRGFGAETTTGPRENRNWCNELTKAQNSAFEAFWTAFALKKGKNEAAERWYQLGELSVPEYQAIIEAAKAEAGKVLPPGQVRKMAQGWLFEKRYLDYVKPPVSENKRSELEYNRIHKELLSVRNLYAASADPALAAQISALEIKLKAARDAQGCR